MNHGPDQPHCDHCGSTNVLADAYAAWNPKTQRWELDSTFTDYYCNECDDETSITWEEIQ